MIFETHCHLNHIDLYQDIENVIKRGKEAGITRFLVIGYDKETSLKAVEIADEYECRSLWPKMSGYGRSCSYGSSFVSGVYPGDG